MVMTIGQEIMELGKVLANPNVSANYPNLAWEIVWINLCYNSFIVNWFSQNVNTSLTNTQKSLEEMLRDQYPGYKEKTIHNAVYQLRRTLRESPIGYMMSQYIEIENDSFSRGEYNEISKEAVAYSLYKYATTRKITTMRVFDLYKSDATGGLNKEFCTSKDTFIEILRQLNSDNNRVIVAELNMGLDSITINREDKNPIEILQSLVDD